MISVLYVCLSLATVCSGYYRLYDFTDEQIKQIIDEHNRLRALEPAANMQEMVWDQNLAEISKHLASVCVAAHSPGYYRTSRAGYRAIGESLWWRREPEMRKDLRVIIRNLYDEKPFYNFRTNTCLPGQMCGHYTQVVWAESCAVGCSAAYCDKILDRGWSYPGHMVVCHYGPAGNYPRQPYIYGKRCASCPGQCQNGLCPSKCKEIRPNMTSTYFDNKLQSSYNANVEKISGISAETRSKLPSSACKDRHHLCAFWASRRQCDSNPTWMKIFCRASCFPKECSNVLRNL